MNASPAAAIASSRTQASSPRALRVGGIAFPEPGVEGTHIPIRRQPAGLALDDPPRGRVLIVHDDAAQALELQCLLRGAGYRVCGPVSTLPEVERLIERVAIDCAIIDCAVNERTPLPVADLLAFADIPFVFLASPGKQPSGRHAHRPKLSRPVRLTDLRDAVEEAMRQRVQPANDNCLPAGRVPWPRIYPQL